MRLSPTYINCDDWVLFVRINVDRNFEPLALKILAREFPDSARRMLVMASQNSGVQVSILIEENHYIWSAFTRWCDPLVHLKNRCYRCSRKGWIQTQISFENIAIALLEELAPNFSTFRIRNSNTRLSTAHVGGAVSNVSVLHRKNQSAAAFLHRM
jgi:hypothetical protein